MSDKICECEFPSIFERYSSYKCHNCFRYLKQFTWMVAEERLDQVMYSAFETNHPAILDWVQIKFKLKELK